MNKYDMKDYWGERAKTMGNVQFYPWVTKFYNDFSEYFQKRAINKILGKIGKRFFRSWVRTI